MKKRLLYIIHGFNLGGAEVITAQLASFFKNKFEISVLALDNDGPLREELSNQGIKTYVLERQQGFTLSNFISFYKIIRESLPDIIHAHQYTPCFYSAFTKLAGGTNAPLIFTEHGRHFPDYVSSRRKLFNHLLFTKVNSITAVCEFTKTALLTNELSQTKSIEVIYNGVATQFEKRHSLRNLLNISKDKRIIGYVGSFRAVKNPALAIKSFAKLKSIYPGLVLVMIGDGELKGDLINLAQSLDLNNEIYFTGNLYPARNYMSELDVFIQPSLSEAHSLALLDAQMLGIPAVVNQHGGSSEVINSGLNGVVVKEQCEEEYSKALLYCLENADKLKINSADIAKNYTLEKMLQRYNNLYREFL